MYNRYIKPEKDEYSYCFESGKKRQSGGFTMPKSLLGGLKGLLPDKLDTADLILILILVLLMMEDEDDELLIILALMVLGV